MNLIAVTACPTGIAHSQMAAENLETTAAEMGHEIQVEVEGAMGTENELSSEQIAAADAVIVAADTTVHTDRFEGVPVIKGSVKDAVNDPEDLIRRAEDEAGSDDGETPADTGTVATDDTGTAATDDAGAATTDETDATTADDAGAATGSGAAGESATEGSTATDTASGGTGTTATEDDAETAGDEETGRASRRERKGLVGKIKSLFS